MTQALIDSLLRAAQISLLSVGLTLVYSLLRFPNCAHVEFAVLGAYVTLVMKVVVGLPLVAAAVVGMLATLAIEKAASTNPGEIKDQMGPVSKTYKGVTGDKTFDGNGMQVDETYRRMICKDGELVPYES